MNSNPIVKTFIKSILIFVVGLLMSAPTLVIGWQGQNSQGNGNGSGSALVEYSSTAMRTTVVSQGSQTAEIISPSPSSTLASTTVCLVWTSGVGVTGYWLYLGKSVGSFEYLNQDQGINRSKTVANLPNNGSRIYARLWSKIGSSWFYNDCSYFACPGCKPDLPGKVSQIAPSGTVNTNQPIYIWSAVAGASWYQLWVNDSASTSGKIRLWFTAAQAGCDLGSEICSVNPNVVLSPGAAQWWVQTWNEGGFGQWSDGVFFLISDRSIPGKAVQVAPYGNTLTNKPTYKWNAVAVASWYQLWVNDTSTNLGKIKVWYTAAQAGCSNGTGTCAITPDIAVAAGKCRWWIQTWNDAGYGPWSDGMDFAASQGIIGPYGIQFVSIPAGEFQMGSSSYSYMDEKPVHRVMITKGFEMGRYEITQDQWETVMGYNPSLSKGATLPVESVSWEDVQQFIANLNTSADGYTYRLPTEAEWEYACRAGTTGDYATTDLDAMAWYWNNSGNRTHPIGTRKPNAWGLYDMHGNVWEWIQDWYLSNYYILSPTTDPQGPGTGVYRVYRGGSYAEYSAMCRSAERNCWWPDIRNGAIGFRLARVKR